MIIFKKLREMKKGLRRKGRVQEIGMEWSERHASSTDSLSLPHKILRNYYTKKINLMLLFEYAVC